MALSKLYQRSGDLNSAETVLTKLLEVTGGTGSENEVRNLRQIGIIYFRWRNYEEAFNQFETAIKISLKLQNETLIALGYNDLANIYKVYGDLDTSVQLLLKSYDIHVSEGNKTGQASVLNNLGAVYSDKGDYEEAIVSYRRAYSLLNNMDQPIRAASTLSSLGVTFDLNGDKQKAVALLTQAASIFDAQRAYRYLGYTYLLLAEIEIKAEDPKQAQHWVDQAILATNLVHSSQKSPQLGFVQGLIWAKQGNYSAAISAFEQASSEIESNKEYKLQQRLYTAMAEVSEKTNDYQASSLYWKKYAETLNSQLTLKDAIGTSRLQTVISFTPPSKSEPDYSRIAIYAGAGVLLLSLMFFATKLIKHRRHQAMLTSRARPDSSIDANQPAQIEHIGSNGIAENKADNASSDVQEQKQPKSTASYDKEAVFKATDEQANEYSEDQVLQVRTQLVDLMHQSLQMWEETTQTGKLELAQQSKIWSVGIDDGRLRARAMERYFSLNTLPQKPRWRSVVRTCNFVLQKCQGKSLFREELEANLKDFQDKMKKTSLVSSKVSVVDSDICRHD
nr:tetratricopeptide repeat protein [Shewanella submarina]